MPASQILNVELAGIRFNVSSLSLELVQLKANLECPLSRNESGPAEARFGSEVTGRLVPAIGTDVVDLNANRW